MSINLKFVYGKRGYNVTRTLLLQNGFVMDIGSIECVHRNTNARISSHSATINSQMEFKYIIFSRFFFHFEVEKPKEIPNRAIGSVIMKPEEFYFSLSVNVII